MVVPQGVLFAVSPPPGTVMHNGMEAVLTVSYGPSERSA